MRKESWLALLRREKAIAVIRTPDAGQGWYMAHAVAHGGMRLIEITWNSDRPGYLIHRLRHDLPDCIIGAGTLLTPAQVKEAIAAGAQFLFTPHTHPELIDIAILHDVPLVAGALTPTEIVTAWQAGSAGVKVFPIQTMGGTEYLKCLRGPLGDIPLIPTGGVTLDNASSFLDAGALAVGLSGQLFPAAAIATHNWARVTEQAMQLMRMLHSQQ